MNFVINIIIFIYLFSPIILSAILLALWLVKSKSILATPPLITIIYTIYKYIQVSFNTGSGGFEGFAIIVLPVLGFSVMIISYTIFKGVIYLKSNLRNKSKLTENITIIILMCGVLAGGYHNQNILFMWPVVRTETSWLNALYWDKVFRGESTANSIRNRSKDRKYDMFERRYVSSKLYGSTLKPIDLGEDVYEALADVFADDSEILFHITQQPLVTENMLRKLSNSSNTNALKGVASNPKTPVDILEKLYYSKTDVVKHGLAKNPRTPAPICNEIANDGSIELAEASKIGCLKGSSK